MELFRTKRWTELLHECLFTSICNISQLSKKEHWTTNQLINQQTNNKSVKPFRKWFTMSYWPTDCEYLSLLYFVQPINKLVRHLLQRRKKVLCKWLTEYMIAWFTVLGLCTSPQDIHVCSLSYQLTYSSCLPPFVCHPQHPLCLLFCSLTK